MCVCVCVCQSLEVLLRARGLAVQQLGEAGRSGRQQQRDSEERQALGLRERDGLLSQLQSALHARSQEAEVLSSPPLLSSPVLSSPLCDPLLSSL